MSNRFASGKYSHGYCDRCGNRAKLFDLKSETVRGRSTSNRVCPSCFDHDHPQNFQGMVPIDDPQALRVARPDPALEASRQIPDNGKSISDLFIP
jgi:RNA polymerase subunit RPABC4/transcription elongation factor Spt4